MRLRANLGHDARGWLADLKELRFDNELLARGSLRWLQDARGREIDVNADELHLTRLMPWLAVWRDAPPALSQAARLSGAGRKLVLLLHTGGDGKPHTSTNARLALLPLAPPADRNRVAS